MIPTGSILILKLGLEQIKEEILRKTRKVTVDDTKATCYNGQESERYQKTQHLIRRSRR